MSPLIQTIIVLAVVAGSVAYVAWQAYRTLRGKRSRVGSCCATGCAKPPESKPSPDRVIYVPANLLGRGRKN